MLGRRPGPRCERRCPIQPVPSGHSSLCCPCARLLRIHAAAAPARVFRSVDSRFHPHRLSDIGLACAPARPSISLCPAAGYGHPGALAARLSVARAVPVLSSYAARPASGGALRRTRTFWRDHNGRTDDFLADFWRRYLLETSSGGVPAAALSGPRPRWIHCGLRPSLRRFTGPGHKSLAIAARLIYTFLRPHLKPRRTRRRPAAPASHPGCLPAPISLTLRRPANPVRLHCWARLSLRKPSRARPSFSPGQDGRPRAGRLALACKATAPSSSRSTMGLRPRLRDLRIIGTCLPGHGRRGARPARPADLAVPA